MSYDGSENNCVQMKAREGCNCRHSMGMECSSKIICKKLNQIAKAQRKIKNLLAQVRDCNCRHNMGN